VGALHHVEIYVSDLAASRAFYQDLLEPLGYSVFQEWDKGVSFIEGDCYLVFVQAEERFLKDGYHRCRVGLNHLAFRVGSRAEVDSLRLRLIEKNVPLLYDERYPYAGGEGYYALYFEGPDRVKLEVTAAK